MALGRWLRAYFQVSISVHVCVSIVFCWDVALGGGLYCICVCRKWRPGQPDNWSHGHDEGEDCAGLVHGGKWNDFYCDEQLGFICERAVNS